MWVSRALPAIPTPCDFEPFRVIEEQAKSVNCRKTEGFSASSKIGHYSRSFLCKKHIACAILIKKSEYEMKTELLSPAGDMCCAVQAIKNGADAIYLGGRSFGARAFAQNFSYDQMAEAIALAHAYGARAYVTVNTLVYEHETTEFLKHTEQVLKAGADALIMQDIGMIDAVRRRFPEALIHASTQMHNHNDASLEYAKKQGAVRAVLAREMRIEQMRALGCDIEKEVFVHGALCISFSGQCLFSALTQQRSGNRGTCAQSCRMRYKLNDAQGSQSNGYLLSPKDLALFEDIGALLEAGIGFFKIEGRLKSPEYVGLVTRIYAGLLRQYHAGLPLKTDSAEIEDLKKLFNRGFTKGHLFSVRGNALMSKDRPNHRGVALGRVVRADKTRIVLRLDAALCQGDGIKFEHHDDGFICNKLYKKGMLVSKADARETVELDAKAKTMSGDTAVKTSDTELLKKLQIMPDRRVPIRGRLTAKLGQPLLLALSDDDGHTAQAVGEIVVQSRTSAVTLDSLRESIAKLGDTPYVLESLDVDSDEGIFIAKSALNALRREVAAGLTALRTAIKPLHISDDAQSPVCHQYEEQASMLHVLVRTKKQFDVVCSLGSGDIYTEDEAFYMAHKMACPQLRLKTDRLAENPLPYGGERLLVTDTGGLHLYATSNDAVLDYFVSALNAQTLVVLVKSGMRRVTLSPELDATQIAQMIEAYREQNEQMPPLEAIVWGRRELMAMRHCLVCGSPEDENCTSCKKQPLWLEDIKGKQYPVLTDAQCQSRILENKPYEANVAALEAHGIRHFRVELFDEDAAQTKLLLCRILRQLDK